MRENEPCQKVKSDDEEFGYCDDANAISNGDNDVKNTTEFLLTMIMGWMIMMIIEGWMQAQMGDRRGGDRK